MMPSRPGSAQRMMRIRLRGHALDFGNSNHWQESDDFLKTYSRMNHVELEGLFTQFAAAEAPGFRRT